MFYASHLVVLWVYHWFCAQKSLLANLGHIKYQGLKLGQPCARQVPYPWYYHSSPKSVSLKKFFKKDSLNGTPSLTLVQITPLKGNIESERQRERAHRKRDKDRERENAYTRSRQWGREGDGNIGVGNVHGLRQSTLYE